MAVFGVLVAPVFYRMVRSVTLGTRNELYVDAARVVGLSDLRIVGRHVLWAVRAPVIIQALVHPGRGHRHRGGRHLPAGEPGRGVVGSGDAERLQQHLQQPDGHRGSRAGDHIDDPVADPVRQRAERRAAVLRTGKPLPPRRRRQVLAAARVAEPAAAASGTWMGRLLAVRGLRIAYRAGGEVARSCTASTSTCAAADPRPGRRVRLGQVQIAFSTLGILPAEALILSGSVLLDGEDLLADPARMRQARGRRIGYVPQEPMSNLDPSFTVGRQLAYGLKAATSR